MRRVFECKSYCDVQLDKTALLTESLPEADVYIVQSPSGDETVVTIVFEPEAGENILDVLPDRPVSVFEVEVSIVLLEII